MIASILGVSGWGRLLSVKSLLVATSNLAKTNSNCFTLSRIALKIKVLELVNNVNLGFSYVQFNSSLTSKAIFRKSNIFSFRVGSPL